MRCATPRGSLSVVLSRSFSSATQPCHRRTQKHAVDVHELSVPYTWLFVHVCSLRYRRLRLIVSLISTDAYMREACVHIYTYVARSRWLKSSRRLVPSPFPPALPDLPRRFLTSYSGLLFLLLSECPSHFPLYRVLVSLRRLLSTPARLLPLPLTCFSPHCPPPGNIPPRIAR